MIRLLLPLFIFSLSFSARAERFDVTKSLASLRRDKVIYVQKFADVPTSYSNEQILRGYLVGQILCQIQSDAAKESCEDLLNSEEMDAQKSLTLKSFTFNAASLRMVLLALSGALEGSLLSLTPDQTPDLREVLLATNVALSSSTDAGASATSIADLLQSKSAAFAIFDSYPTLKPFANLMREIPDWLKCQRKTKQISFAGPAWFAMSDDAKNDRCHISSRGGRVSCVIWGNPLAIPAEVAAIPAADIFSSGTQSFCIKGRDQKLRCWGIDRRGSMEYWSDPLGGNGEVWTGVERSINDVILRSADGNDICRDRRCRGTDTADISYVMLSREEKSFAFLRQKSKPHEMNEFGPYEKVDENLGVILPGGTVSLPANATSLTLIQDRLYYLEGSELRSQAYGSNSSADFISAGFYPHRLVKLEADHQHFCGLYLDGHWNCINPLQASYYRRPNADAQMIAGGELFLDSMMVSVGPRTIAVSNYVDSDGRSWGNFEAERPTGATQLLPMKRHVVENGYMNAEYLLLCFLRAGAPACILNNGKTQSESLPLLRPYKRATALLADQKYVCIADGNNANCLDRSVLPYDPPAKPCPLDGSKKPTGCQNVVSWDSFRSQYKNYEAIPVVLSSVLADPKARSLTTYGSGICKIRGTEISCLTFKDRVPTQTSMQLPTDESFVRMVNQENLCLQTTKAVRCFEANGSVQQNFLLKFEAAR